MIRECKTWDPDYRRNPKTQTFCVYCQKDMKPESIKFEVRLIDGGATILHSEDESLYIPDSGDMGYFAIGSDCAKRLGMEWVYRCNGKTK